MILPGDLLDGELLYIQCLKRGVYIQCLKRGELSLLPEEERTPNTWLGLTTHPLILASLRGHTGAFELMIMHSPTEKAERFFVIDPKNSFTLDKHWMIMFSNDCTETIELFSQLMDMPPG